MQIKEVKPRGVEQQIYNSARQHVNQLTRQLVLLYYDNRVEVSNVRRGSLKGYAGRVNRVVKTPGARMEHFIHGTPETTFEQALRDNWPFKDHDVKSKWRLVTDKGVDVTKSTLSSHEGTVLIEFLP